MVSTFRWAVISRDMAAMPATRLARWHPDPRRASPHPAPALPALLAGKWSQSRQLLVTLVDASPFHAVLPTSIKGKKEGEQTAHLREARKTHPHAGGFSQDKGSVGGSSVCAGLASGVQAPVPQFSPSWHSTLPFLPAPSKLLHLTSSTLARDKAPTHSAATWLLTRTVVLGSAGGPHFSMLHPHTCTLHI